MSTVEIRDLLERYIDGVWDNGEPEGCEVVSALLEAGHLQEAILMMQVIKLDWIDFRLGEIAQALGGTETTQGMVPVWYALKVIASQGPDPQKPKEGN